MNLAGGGVGIGSNQIEACLRHHCIERRPIKKADVKHSVNLLFRMIGILLGYLSENVATVPQTQTNRIQGLTGL